MSKSGSQGELLSSDAASTTRKPIKTGLLVTNHLNLMYMHAAGLVMPPSGFGGKYYGDTLQFVSGWIPLFVPSRKKAEQPPPSAIDSATREAAHLRPAIVELNLEGMRGPVRVLGEQGWTERRLENGVGPGDRLVLLPAPLPASRMRRILFRSASERDDTLAEAEERRNVPLVRAMCRVGKAAFSGSTRDGWPPRTDLLEERTVKGLDAAQAAGGILATLQDLANSGETAVRACRAAFDTNSEPPDDRILRPLPDWLAGDAPSQGTGQEAPREFWRVVDLLVTAWSRPGGLMPQDVLIDYLAETAKAAVSDRMAHANGLRDMLRELHGGLQGDRVSDMLYEYKRPMARAMILFVLRDRYAELADIFEQYCEQLSETDRLAAAILFGAREGWLRLPVALRGTPALTAAVTHRMAARAHRVDNSGFELGETPPRVIPLRELLGAADMHQEAALLLARRMGWPCIRSRIALRRGEYRLAVDGGAAAIDFEGEAPVTTWVVHDELLALLASQQIGSTVEEEVRQRAK